jgi:hypothetical protein
MADGKLLVKCFAGCSQESVITALKRRGVWPPSSNGDKPQKARIVKTYDYHDAFGKLIFQVCRMEPKRFLQRRPDPARPGEFIWKMDGVSRVPYRLPALSKADTVFVPEGEKDVDRLAVMGLAATTNPGGANKWKPEYNQYFQGKAVVILPDNDDVGRQHAQDVARNLHGIARSVKVLELPGLPDKGDVSDWIASGGTKEQLLDLVSSCSEWEQQAEPKAAPIIEIPKAPPKEPYQITGITGSELSAKEFPELKEIIKNFLTVGYGLIGGRPKIGKSWLAFAIALAAAHGGNVFGSEDYPAEKGKVLYLALEDTERRLQKRQSQLLYGVEGSDNLILSTELPRLNEGGLQAIDTWLKANPDCRLVIIDTLAKVKPRQKRGADPYENDMDIGGQLQTIANKHDICLLAVHHTRKAKSEADDFLDELAGSTGITGAADFVMVLSRGRGADMGNLKITGRDIDEKDMALEFSKGTGEWTYKGDAKEWNMSQNRLTVLNCIKKSSEALTPRDVADFTGMIIGSVKNTISELYQADLINKSGHGKYSKK